MELEFTPQRTFGTATTRYPSPDPSLTDDLAETPHPPHIAEEGGQETPESLIFPGHTNAIERQECD